MRDTGDTTYTPSSSQPLNPNIPYSPDGKTDACYHNMINTIFQNVKHTVQAIKNV
jgi:hypothetical protein